MKFKIDTKEKIVIFSPEGDSLDANLSASFITGITHYPDLEGRNLILDMAGIEKTDAKGKEAILAVYQHCYENNRSCALARLHPDLAQFFTQNHPEVLNLAPTLDEAVDLVMMEELEREIGNGDWE
ncbi:STAS domain-containing protein [uncultured Chitinophaga sp.]|uniref:STAS domain-containing protein n=1 Tax=uncultured Chitinophaga sp. TaxID=339340 RepID=UPI0025E7DD86|nr:STAS domain-containing protein [uncultured Chitinophaga sp.]